MQKRWVKGEIMAASVTPPRKILIREAETGKEYPADRYCDRRRDENGDLWFEVEVRECQNT